MNTFLFTLIAATALTASPGQDLSGKWHGHLNLGMNRMRIAFNISGGQAPTATLDSPDQGALGLKGEVSHLSGDSVSLKFPNIGAAYKARLSNDSLKGTFSQGMINIPLDMARGDFDLKRPQTPLPPFPYSTEEITITNPDFPDVSLAGTLTLPEETTDSTPVVVFISGSGQQNRDEEMFGHKPFAVIADALARQGIASFRYDDRGTAGSTGNAKDVSVESDISDASAVFDAIRNMKRFGKTGLLGHSEGGRIAFRLAADGKSRPDFIIGIGTPAMRGDSILADQNMALLGKSGMPREWTENYVRSMLGIYAALIEGNREKATDMAKKELERTASNPPEHQLAKNLVRIAELDNKWLSQFISDSPADDIAASTCPALAIFGELDTQVLPVNASEMRRLNPGVEVRLFPELNHLMQHASTGTIAEYGEIEETISPEVISTLIHFIEAQKQK